MEPVEAPLEIPILSGSLTRVYPTLGSGNTWSELVRHFQPDQTPPHSVNVHSVRGVDAVGPGGTSP